MGRLVTFRGLDLTSGIYRISDTDAFSAPPRDVTVKELARSDTAVELYKRFRPRTINFSGYMKASTSDLVDAGIDTLKAQLFLNGDLDMGWNAGTRRWTGAMQNINIARSGQELTVANYSFQLLCVHPFGWTPTIATLLNQAVTTASSTPAITSAVGNFYAIPVIKLTITSIFPTSTPVTVTIGNPAASRYMAITGTFANGDTITIDSVNGQVYHNSTLIQPVGQFPMWLPGSGTLSYADTASSRNITILAQYFPRYF